jgi:hypothetical protein
MPGDGGEIYLSPTSLPGVIQNKIVKNPHLDIHVVMTGDRSGPDSGSVSSTDDISIKMLSNLALTAKSYRNVGSLTNIGPIPPRSDVASSYTLTWTLTNTSNDLKDTTVSATLPVGVVWNNETSPSSERITYASDSRTVIWNVGNVSAGTGYNYSPKTVSFKVIITPSVNQVGSTPELLTNITATANDTYAASPLTTTVEPVTTQYSDPGFKLGDNTVVK